MARTTQTEQEIETALCSIDDEVLGRLLKEYVQESNHRCNVVWEGFTSRDMTGIRRFLSDLIQYNTHTGARNALRGS